MSSESTSSMSDFIADRWVSWMLELLVLGLIAYFTISENRKTAEQTREMLARYDAAVSAYAARTTQAVDQTVSDAVASSKEAAKTITKKDVEELLKSMKENDVEPE